MLGEHGYGTTKDHGVKFRQAAGFCQYNHTLIVNSGYPIKLAPIDSYDRFSSIRKGHDSIYTGIKATLDDSLCAGNLR